MLTPLPAWFVMRPLVLLALLVTALPTSAQTPGACQLGTAYRDLATPDLLARLYNNGSLFYGAASGIGDGYLVPRAPARSPLYAAGLWLAGRVGGEVRAAGARYDNFTFWPGPLDSGAALPNPINCMAYDRIWVVSPADVAAYEAGGTATADLAEWPVGLGAPTVDASGQPVVAASREQVVDLAAGERPAVYGGPTAFWVMNDVGGPHTTLGTEPLGVEVRVTAAAPATGSEVLRQTTIYRYEIVNRSAQTIEDLHAGFFMDPDLGNASDDYVGVDTTRALAFVYNADNLDEGAAGYGVPPAFGLDVLSSPLWASSYIVGAGVGNDDPLNGAEYYNRLRGRWNDDSPIRAFGNGHQQVQGDTTRFTYTGDPVVGAFWSARNTDGAGTPNAAHDQRLMVSVPPVTLAPGEATTLDFALEFGQGVNHLVSISALRFTSDTVQALYDSGALFSPNYPPVTLPPPVALLAPADGTDFNTERPDAITFAWTAADGADDYLFELSPSADFDTSVVIRETPATELTLATDSLPPRALTFYWRVTSRRLGAGVWPSEVWSFEYAVEPPVFRAFLAPANAQGPLVPAEPAALGSAGFPTLPDGRDEPSDAQQSLSDNRWLVFTGGPYYSTFDDWVDRTTRGGANNPRVLSNDFEIRFTGSSVALLRFQGTGSDVMTVPFELWNVGSGTPDDPSDDVRLVPWIFDFGPESWSTGEGDGVFGFAYDAEGLSDSQVSPDEDDPYTDWIYFYNPVDMSPGQAGYFAYENGGTPDVLQVGDEVMARLVLVSWDGRPRADTHPLPEPGTVFRIVTSPSPVAGEPGPATSALALAPPQPNPARAHVTLPYRLAAAGHVRLTVVDALGRTVATLADGVQPAGEHTAAFDTRRLAPGVYAVVLDAVVLDADGRRATRRITVAR